MSGKLWEIVNYLSRLTEERVDEFLIEKYIEISIGINIRTGIVCADPDPHFYSVTMQQRKGSTFIYLQQKTFPKS